MSDIYFLQAKEIVKFSVQFQEPVPQGSKKAFVIPKTNRAVLVDDNATKLKPWRSLVSIEASQAMQEYGAVPINGAVGIQAVFAFNYLKSHYKADGVTLKEGHPYFKATKPDTDKLQRALGDAMSGICYRDDAQVAEWRVKRIYGAVAGVTVRVYAL